MDLMRHPGAALRVFSLHRVAVAVACVVALPHRPVLGFALAAAQIPVALLLRRLADADAPSRGQGRRLLLPYVLWLACWLEVGWLLGLAGQPTHDAGLAAADLAVFGVHWHARLATIAPGAAVGEAMHALYLSYYALILGPPLVLALSGRREDCARYTAAVMATYLACFLVYTVFPVLGPRALAAATGNGAEAAGGAVAGLAEGLRRAGDVQGTAFPSSHCAGALAAALAAGELLARRQRIALLVWAGLIAVSTVHTGNHYALDAAAGLLLALGVRSVLVRSFAVRTARTEEVPS